MSGLILLLVLFVYAALVYWVATRFTRAWIRWAIALVAVFGPFVESAIARYRVAALCRSEHGVHYLRHISNLDGVYFNDRTHLAPTYFVEELGLSYQEYPSKNGEGVTRYSVGAGGQRTTVDDLKPAARYELRERTTTNLAGNIARSDTNLVDRTTGEVVAYARDFAYRGDWLIRYLRRSRLPVSSDIDCGRPLSTDDLIRPALTNDYPDTKEEKR